MDGATTINAAWDQANRLTDALQLGGATADEAEHESDLFWTLAASVAKVEDDPELRRTALVRLRDREQAPDPFAGFPRAAQF